MSLYDLPPDDLDMLADLLAGEGTEEQVARVAASPELSQALADLAEVEGLVLGDLADLADIEDVEPPAGFDERLAAAFAAESGPPARSRPQPGGPGDAGPSHPTSGDATAGTTENVVPLGASTRRDRAQSPWLLRSAAGFIALVLAGGLGFVVTQGTGDDDSADSVSAASAQAPVPTSASGRDYSGAGELAAALPSLLGAPAKALAEGSAADRSAQAPAPASGYDSSVSSGATGSTSGGSLGAGTSGSSGSASTSGSATAGAAPVMPMSPNGSGPVPGASQQLSASASQALARLRTPAGLQACYTALELPPGTRPLALDYATFEGKPALVILLPIAARPTQVEAYVVGAGCGAGDAEITFFGRLDRP